MPLSDHKLENAQKRDMPPLNAIFPYEYIGGGFWRQKAVKRGEKAKILHGDEAIKFLYEKMSEIT